MPIRASTLLGVTDVDGANDADAERPERAKGARACRADRPRERLRRLGPAALSDAEVVALVLRTGDRARDAPTLSRSILERFGGLSGLAATSGHALEVEPGLGPAKVASLLASVELGRRVGHRRLERGRPIRNPIDVQRHFAPGLAAARRESFHVLLLDGRHRLIAVEDVSVGTLNASLVHPREVFRDAIRSAAAALVLVHNHPSGDPSPSAEDRRVTARLQAAGALLGIEVVDHVIVAEGGHFSFREAGELSLGSDNPRGCAMPLNASGGNGR